MVAAFSDAPSDMSENYASAGGGASWMKLGPRVMMVATLSHNAGTRSAFESQWVVNADQEPNWTTMKCRRSYHPRSYFSTWCVLDGSLSQNGVRYPFKLRCAALRCAALWIVKNHRIWSHNKTLNVVIVRVLTSLRNTYWTVPNHEMDTLSVWLWSKILGLWIEMFDNSRCD